MAGEVRVRFDKPLVWIIIDTKAQVLAGGDPNSDQDIMALVGSVALMRDATGAHVTIIDHVPHGDQDRLKGSGALAGAIDGSFLVKNADGDHKIGLGSKRPNDGPDELDVHFRLESVVIGTAGDGKETTAPVVVPADAQDVIISLGGGPLAGNPRKGVKLKAAAQRVWLAWGRLMDEGRNCPAPPALGVRPGTRAVTHADLQAKTYELGLISDPEPPRGGDEHKIWQARRRQAWSRGHGELLELGFLRSENGLLWDPRGVTVVTDGVTGRDEP